MKYIFQILKSARQLRGYYAGISLITILVSLSGLLLPVIIGWAVDEVNKGTAASINYLLLLAVGIFLVDLFHTFLNNLGGYLGDQMSAKLHRVLSNRYYNHVINLSQSYFDKQLSGKIINRLSRSIAQITNFMQMVSNNFLQFIFTTIFALILITFYSWQVAAFLFALYPIYIWLTIRTSDKWQKYQEQKNLHEDIATGRFTEAIGQIKVVKSFMQQKAELQFFDKHLKKIININKPQSAYWHKRDVRRRFVLNIIFLFVFGFIFVQAAQGQYSPGVAVSLIFLAQQIRIPIFTISFLVENTQRAIADSKDYFSVLNVLPEAVDDQGAEPLRVKEGKIVFEDLAFSYDHRPLLKNISFMIEPGSKTALVGESGEGKTTLTNLLLRLYRPQQGRILIDGQDIAHISRDTLRDNIGVVFQDPALFSGTIRENIAYANPTASQSEVVSAAKAANAHDFVEKLEKGYSSQIGERGLKLSGGQKQRIAIARALLKDAPILILDEATSSLDSKSEKLVQEALTRLMNNRTTIIIAHRLSTISHVDQIVSISNGQISEIGSPAQLAKSGGIYSELLELQRGKKTKTVEKKLKSYELTN